MSSPSQDRPLYCRGRYTMPSSSGSDYNQIWRSIMRWPVLALTCVLGTAVVVSGQSALDAKTQSQLKTLFPQATGFSPRSGDLPVFKAYSGDPKAASPAIAGYAFYTTE